MSATFHGLAMVAIEEYRKKRDEGYDHEVAESFAVEEVVHASGYLGIVTATDCCGVLPDTVERHSADCENSTPRLEHVDTGTEITLPDADREVLAQLRDSLSNVVTELRRQSGGQSEGVAIMELLGPVVLNLTANIAGLKALHSMDATQVPMPIRRTHLNVPEPHLHQIDQT